MRFHHRPILFAAATASSAIAPAPLAARDAAQDAAPDAAPDAAAHVAASGADRAPRQAGGTPAPAVHTPDAWRLAPLFTARLRYEGVASEGADRHAEAVTLRARFGLEARRGGLSLLVEGEGTAALADGYNDTLPGNGAEPFPVIADPETLELNRAQLSWRGGPATVTVGRQRIVHGNARFVGNVGWRQNEQTFDAVRGEAAIGPVAIDFAYAAAQRTIFGAYSPGESHDGDFWLASGTVRRGPFEGRAFAYLVDYDLRPAFSSQTYGAIASGATALGPLELRYRAGYAVQSDHGSGPVAYRADYVDAEVAAASGPFTLAAGYEKLGSDEGVAAFQTPLATLHAFNGWADMFLATPPAGLRDRHVRLSARFGGADGETAIDAQIAYHRFDSDYADIAYGQEWNLSLGTRLGPVALLAKYAHYDARDFGADTRKFWLQAEYAF
ncbi:alginate export family protein [Pelagerythrobacter marinus]|uniref:alginate export family protein n=1 Tax=Pelagerythrobacter marinus TaxID=538382 RepID=UPI00203668DD|nr:alginate export family protein [Pelagerythrobacter marinus]USA40108.1 alginate export family protein [Pelagerythrobacter marinus]WPZ05770.1 alginate export family protein [Pelagerythrobacter marinus]